MTCTGEAPKDYSLENELLISVTGNGDGKSESGSEMADSSLVVLTRDEDSDGESSAGEVNELPDEHAKTPDEQLSIQSSDQLKGKFTTDDEEASELIDGQKLNQVRWVIELFFELF